MSDFSKFFDHEDSITVEQFHEAFSGSMPQTNEALLPLATVIVGSDEEIQRHVYLESDTNGYQTGWFSFHGRMLPCYRDIGMNPF